MIERREWPITGNSLLMAISETPGTTRQTRQTTRGSDWLCARRPCRNGTERRHTQGSMSRQVPRVAGQPVIVPAGSRQDRHRPTRGRGGLGVLVLQELRPCKQQQRFANVGAGGRIARKAFADFSGGLCVSFGARPGARNQLDLRSHPQCGRQRNRILRARMTHAREFALDHARCVGAAPLRQRQLRTHGCRRDRLVASRNRRPFRFDPGEQAAGLVAPSCCEEGLGEHEFIREGRVDIALRTRPLGGGGEHPFVHPASLRTARAGHPEGHRIPAAVRRRRWIRATVAAANP